MTKRFGSLFTELNYLSFASYPAPCFLVMFKTFLKACIFGSNFLSDLGKIGCTSATLAHLVIQLQRIDSCSRKI